jgi:Flp pilus assembly protein TadG
MMAMIKRLARDISGGMAVEFALLTTSLFFAFLAVFDFAGLLIGAHRLSQAVSASADDAFVNRASVSFTAIPTYVINASGLSSASVTALCNGSATCTNTSRACACLTTTGTYAAATCGSVCSGSSYSANQTAGYYLTVTASYPYSGVIVPAGMLQSATVSRAVTIRLQ